MADTVQLHVKTRGQGLPVVLLHGFPFDHRIWQAQAEALSDAYYVITPDLRGHGHSPAPEGTYSMDLLASDVFALLDDLGIDRAVWVGQSMGGYVAMAALRIAPERIVGVGLVATHPHPDPPEKCLQRIQSAAVALEKGPADLAVSMMGVLFAPSVNRQSPMAQAIYDIMARTSPLGVAGALRGMADRPDSVPTLQAMHVPAVAVAGTADQIVKLDVMQRMVDLMPHASLAPIADAGHMVMVEHPEGTTAALRTFLESLAWR